MTLASLLNVCKARHHLCSPFDEAWRVWEGGDITREASVKNCSIDEMHWIHNILLCWNSKDRKYTEEIHWYICVEMGENTLNGRKRSHYQRSKYNMSSRREKRKKTTTTHDAPLLFLLRFLVLEIETHPHFIHTHTHTHTNIDREREWDGYDQHLLCCIVKKSIEHAKSVLSECTHVLAVTTQILPCSHRCRGISIVSVRWTSWLLILACVGAEWRGRGSRLLLIVSVGGSRVKTRFRAIVSRRIRTQSWRLDAETIQLWMDEAKRNVSFTNLLFTLDCAPLLLSLGPPRSSLKMTVGRRI